MVTYPPGLFRVDSLHGNVDAETAACEADVEARVLPEGPLMLACAGFNVIRPASGWVSFDCMTSHRLGRSSSSYPRCGEAPNGRQPHDEPQQLTRTRLLASSESRRSLQPTRRGSYCDSRAGPVVGSFVPGRTTDESRVCTHTRRTFTCVHSLIGSGYATGSTACVPSALV